MQGVLDRFLPTLFFVITTAAGHSNSVQSAWWLVGYIYLVRDTFGWSDYSFEIRFSFPSEINIPLFYYNRSSKARKTFGETQKTASYTLKWLQNGDKMTQTRDFCPITIWSLTLSQYLVRYRNDRRHISKFWLPCLGFHQGGCSVIWAIQVAPSPPMIANFLTLRV